MRYFYKLHVEYNLYNCSSITISSHFQEQHNVELFLSLCARYFKYLYTLQIYQQTKHYTDKSDILKMSLKTSDHKALHFLLLFDI